MAFWLEHGIKILIAASVMTSGRKGGVWIPFNTESI